MPSSPQTNIEAKVLTLMSLPQRTPQLVRTILGGKFTDVQAALFGLEGHLNAPTVERTLFGGNFGRMSWSINGSPLSRSYINKFGERVGMDPARDPEVRQKIEASKNALPGQMRVSINSHFGSSTLSPFFNPPPPEGYTVRP